MSEAVRTSVLVVGQTRLCAVHVVMIVFFSSSSQGTLPVVIEAAADSSRLVAVTDCAGRRFLQLSSKRAGLPSN